MAEPRPPAICPLLGLADDPASSAAYPRRDHRCGVAGVGAPSAAWQLRYCLTAAHATCPHLTAPAPVARRRDRARWGVAGLAAGCVLALAVGATVMLGDGGAPSAPPVAVAAASAATPSGEARSAPAVVTTALPSPTATRPAATATATRTRPAPTVTPTATTPPIATTPPTVTAPLAPTATPTPAPLTHVVVEGETIEIIAARYGVSAADIATLNDLSNPDIIIPGQELTLPPGAVDSAAAPAP